MVINFTTAEGYWLWVNGRLLGPIPMPVLLLLAGSWKDHRSVDEQVADIYESRH